MSRLERYEELALAMAQAEMQNALNDSKLRRTDIAKKLGVSRPFISKMLRGDYNLTVKAMSRVFAACGYELRFERVAIARRAGRETL